MPTSPKAINAMNITGPSGLSESQRRLASVSVATGGIGQTSGLPRTFADIGPTGTRFAPSPYQRQTSTALQLLLLACSSPIASPRNGQGNAHPTPSTCVPEHGVRPCRTTAHRAPPLVVPRAGAAIRVQPHEARKSPPKRACSRWQQRPRAPRAACTLRQPLRCPASAAAISQFRSATSWSTAWPASSLACTWRQNSPARRHWSARVRSSASLAHRLRRTGGIAAGSGLVMTGCELRLKRRVEIGFQFGRAHLFDGPPGRGEVPRKHCAISRI